MEVTSIHKNLDLVTKVGPARLVWGTGMISCRIFPNNLEKKERKTFVSDKNTADSCTVYGNYL
jgi:hypothetical protein